MSNVYREQSTTVNDYMTAEEKVIENINAYNNAYANYIMCAEPSTNRFTSANTPANCPSSITNSWTTDAATGNVYGGSNTPNPDSQIFNTDGSFATSGATSSLNSFKTNISADHDTMINKATAITTNSGLTLANDVNADKITIQSRFDTNNATRADLDKQLQSLYNQQDSLANMMGRGTDATIYAGVLWTILATSSIYYIFTKL